MSLVFLFAIHRFLLEIVCKDLIFQAVYLLCIFPVYIAGATGGEVFYGVVFLGGPSKAVINVHTAGLGSVGLSATDLSCKIAAARVCGQGAVQGSCIRLIKLTFEVAFFFRFTRTTGTVKFSF